MYTICTIALIIGLAGFGINFMLRDNKVYETLEGASVGANILKGIFK